MKMVDLEHCGQCPNRSEGLVPRLAKAAMRNFLACDSNGPVEIYEQDLRDELNNNDLPITTLCTREQSIGRIAT